MPIEETLYDLVLPVMQCKSSGISIGENRISYVANAGPWNLWGGEGDHPSPDGVLIEFGRNVRPQRDAKMYTVFFDHCCATGPWSDSSYESCTATITVENIAAMDGTSMTILISENEDASHWIWYSTAPGFGLNVPVAVSGVMADGPTPVQWENTVPPDIIWDMERLVGFCFPNDLSSIATGEIPNYVPLQYPADDEGQPLFINEGRKNSGSQILHMARRTRPSSAHPGIVNAAFVDGGVRPLKDDIDRTLFVRLARPGSGVILNPKDLGW